MRPEFHILLVEDSQADAQIIERALRERVAGYRLTVVPEGRQALDYLRQLLNLDCPEEVEPDLILLDLNLPGIDGGQVLKEIKADAVLRAIPTVVLTTSRREEDILYAYEAGANSYIQKPPEYPGYSELAATIQRYWQGTNLRPPKARRSNGGTGEHV
jgi:CheY-like chemotaxis protein